MEVTDAGLATSGLVTDPGRPDITSSTRSQRPAATGMAVGQRPWQQRPQVRTPQPPPDPILAEQGRSGSGGMGLDGWFVARITSGRWARGLAGAGRRVGCRHPWCTF